MRARTGTSSGRRGASLIELIVAMLIVMILMVLIWRLVSTGAQFYHRARSQSDVQRNTMLSLRWIAKDLSEGATISFREYNPPTFAYPGIVFGSPVRPSDGRVHYDSSSGRMYWGSVIGYYIDPADKCLYRQQVQLPDVTRTYPPVIDNDTQSTDHLASLPRSRLVARQIHEISTQQGPKDIKIVLATRDEELGFGIKVQTRLEMKN